jgi:hypothetical protein
MGRAGAVRFLRMARFMCLGGPIVSQDGCEVIPGAAHIAGAARAHLQRRAIEFARSARLKAARDEAAKGDHFMRVSSGDGAAGQGRTGTNRGD